MIVLYRLQALNSEKVRLELDRIAFRYDQEVATQDENYEEIELATAQLEIVNRQLDYLEEQIEGCLSAMPAGADMKWEEILLPVDDTPRK